MNAMMALIKATQVVLAMVNVIFMPIAQIQTEVLLVPVIMVSLGMVSLVQVLTGCDIAIRSRQSSETIKIMLLHQFLFYQYMKSVFLIGLHVVNVQTPKKCLVKQTRAF